MDRAYHLSMSRIHSAVPADRMVAADTFRCSGVVGDYHTHVWAADPPHPSLETTLEVADTCGGNIPTTLEQPQGGVFKIQVYFIGRQHLGVGGRAVVPRAELSCSALSK